MTYYPNNYYLQDLQGMKDRIDNQIRQIQQQPQPITQNFQLAPTQATELESKYASTVDEVKNTFVVKTGLFIDKDFTTLWIKDVTGKIRTFELNEIQELDEKDIQIQELKKQIKELKGVINEHDINNGDEPAPSKKPTRVSSSKKSNV